MASEAAKQQINSSGAIFHVKYIGLIEVKTPLHDVDRSKTEDLAHACAVLIGRKAGIEMNPFIVESEIQELIGSTEPKVINKDVALTITHRFVTLVCAHTDRPIRLIDVQNISIAVVVRSIIPNAFVFFGKVKSPGSDFKRFCFLCQSSNDPENIYSTFEVAFAVCGDSVPSTKNVTSSTLPPRGPPPIQRQEVFKKPRLPERFRKQEDIYDDPTPGVRRIAEPYTQGQSEWIIKLSEMKQKEANEKDDNLALGSLDRRHPGTSAPYSWVDNDDFPPNLDINALSQTLCTMERFKIICEGLEKEPWFFGKIKRTTAEKFLKRDGSFLVRVSETKPCTAILTIRHDQMPYHIMLNDDCGNLKSLGKMFPTIIHLMAYHYRNKIPFTSDDSDPIKLLPLYPVGRPKPLSDNSCY